MACHPDRGQCQSNQEFGFKILSARIMLSALGADLSKRKKNTMPLPHHFQIPLISVFSDFDTKTAPAWMNFDDPDTCSTCTRSCRVMQTHGWNTLLLDYVKLLKAEQILQTRPAKSELMDLIRSGNNWERKIFSTVFFQAN